MSNFTADDCLQAIYDLAAKKCCEIKIISEWAPDGEIFFACIIHRYLNDAHGTYQVFHSDTETNIADAIEDAFRKMDEHDELSR